MKKYLSLLILLPLCIGVDAGFTGSAIGGAVGGYVGGSIASNNNVATYSNDTEFTNGIIIELCDWGGSVYYDKSCGKIKIKTQDATACEGSKYEYVTVDKYLRKLYPNMTGYIMTNNKGGIVIMVKI